MHFHMGSALRHAAPIFHGHFMFLNQRFCDSQMQDEQISSQKIQIHSHW